MGETPRRGRCGSLVLQEFDEIATGLARAEPVAVLGEALIHLANPLASSLLAFAPAAETFVGDVARMVFGEEEPEVGGGLGHVRGV